MRVSQLCKVLLILALVGHNQVAWSHAEHGTGEPIPTIVNSRNLPKGVDLTVVKTTAHQFSLSTDGIQTVEVLGQGGVPFIRIQKAVVSANLNSPDWYRAQQPGGGPIPARLKSGSNPLKLEADWKVLAQQAGLGWYDPRLVDENQKSFKLTLRVNNQPYDVQVQRKPAPAFVGYWTSRILTEPDSTLGLSVLIPGLTTGAISLMRAPGATTVVDVIDTSGKPFLRSAPQGYWVNVEHPWFKDLGLFVNTEQPEIRQEWGKQWIKASASGMLTYQDPRLKSPKVSNKSPRPWKIAMRELGKTDTEHLSGELLWQSVKNSH